MSRKRQRPSETISIPVMRVPVYLVGGILGVFVLLQFVPIQHDNPPVIDEPKWDSPQTRFLAKRACFDCHSNETVWPWYAYVAPASWTVAANVENGRAALNFSEWGGPVGEPGEVAQVVLDGRMPPADYLAQHPEARLTSDEKKQLAAGLLTSLSAQ